jgi:hypothetical protein
MKKSIFLNFILFLGTWMGLMAQERIPQPPNFKPFLMPKLELLGPAMALSYWPLMAIAESEPPSWPAWYTADLELGIGRRTSLVGGIGGKYSHYRDAGWPEPTSFLDAKTMGVKYVLGIRQYITKGDGQGFYLQPTGKLVFHRFKRLSEQGTFIRNQHDWLINFRFGWQVKLVKGLHLDIAAGPGIGIRNEIGNHWQYYSWGISEMDNPRIDLIWRRGRNNTTIALVGDASVALGWKF